MEPHLASNCFVKVCKWCSRFVCRLSSGECLGILRVTFRWIDRWIDGVVAMLASFSFSKVPLTSLYSLIGISTEVVLSAREVLNFYAVWFILIGPIAYFVVPPTAVAFFTLIFGGG